MRICLVKVSPDGKQSSAFATGFRAANGMGIGLNDDIIRSDSQRRRTPVFRPSLVKQGSLDDYNGDPEGFTPAQLAADSKTYGSPMVWIPYEKDGSTGGQPLVKGNKLGPLEGHILSTSYGKCRVFDLMYETADGIPRGATVELPMQFDSGIQRAPISPIDGHINTVGPMGWQTSAVHDGCLQRIRYTGKPLTPPTEFHVTAGSASTTFDPLDPRTANDEQSAGFSGWNYTSSSTHGSAKHKPSVPTEVGTDKVEVTSAKLRPDKKIIVLHIPKPHPVMQLSIELQIQPPTTRRLGASWMPP